MRHLPLYPEGAALPPVLTETPLLRDASCKRCALGGSGAGEVCMDPEGEPGGLLVVGEYPTVAEAKMGRPFTSEAGRRLRRMISKWWQGPIALDMAVKCGRGPGQDVDSAHADACRPYLTSTLQSAKPTRILAFGSTAAQGLLGRGISAWSTRRGYYYIGDTPVFFFLPPAPAFQNRFLTAWLDQDIQWAVTCPLPPKRPEHAVVYLVETPAHAQEAATQLREASAGSWVTFDCETVGRHSNDDFRIVSLAMCAKGQDVAYAWTRDALAAEETLAPLRDLLADAGVKKTGQNIKYDDLSVRNFMGVPVRGIVGDTRLQRKLLYSDADASLETMADLVGMGGHKEEAQAAVARVNLALGAFLKEPTTAAAKARNAALRASLVGHPTDVAAAVAGIRAGHEAGAYAYGLVPFDVLHRYCALDTLTTSKLSALFEEQLAADPELEFVWQDLVHPASIAITQLEDWGLPCDRERVTKLVNELGQKIHDAEEYFKIFPDFDPGSPAKVAKLLFDTLKLPIKSKTPTGAPSTDADTLESLQDLHPVVGHILNYRKLSKVHGTYAVGMLSHIRDDGRVHATFNLDGARSGRSSSSNPNLQNIVRSDAKDSEDLGTMVRECFRCPEGYTFVEGDLAQAELRVGAILSGDPVMRDIFVSGADYHLRTAQMISELVWKIPPDQVDDKHRHSAKTFNLAVFYGQGDKALAATMGCSVAKANEIRTAIFGKFTQMDKWIKDSIAEGERTGVARTFWRGRPGRKSYVTDIAGVNEERQSTARTGAYNRRIQGSTSDMCIASITQLTNWILENNLQRDVQVVLTVHDSIMLLTRDDLVPMVQAKMKEVMESWGANGVPIVADFKVGKSWGNMKKWGKHA
jgi:uracil-DNA glycosylase family 4